MIFPRLRLAIQSASFLFLTYGARFAPSLGHFLPCFACPYVRGCPGHCYLMALQGSQWGFEMGLASLASIWGLKALLMLAGFVLLAFLLSKAWCGWICPFGSLQDAIAFLRKKLGIRESRFSWTLRDRLKPVKYTLLGLLIVIPILIAHAGLHSDFELPFCQMCPAKPIMPLFEGNPDHLAIDTTNPITTVMTVLSVVTAAMVLVGAFFKNRFFCIFCPMLAVLSIFDRTGLVRLKKNPDACLGCGNCQRACPVDIRDVHLEKAKENVTTQDCMFCGKCAEACPQDGSLSLKVWLWTLFSSSRSYVATRLNKGR